MKWQTWLLGLALSISGVGCTDTTPPAPPSVHSAPLAAPTLAEQMNQGSPANPTADHASASPLAAAQPTAAQAVNTFPTIPQGAAWTLYCLTINTATHVPDADNLKNALAHKTHSNEWYVVHGQGDSKLYYGYYRTFTDANDPAERDRAQADRKTIENLKDDNGDTPFEACAFQPLDAPDPDAPPEWDIRNAPGFWALNIASYRGTADRKKAAVDAVRAARAMGVNAYYYHGPAISSVLLGPWPREAIKEQDETAARASDPNRTVMVTTDRIPKGVRTDNIYMPDGSPVKLMEPKVEIADPTLIATMKEYPNNAVNGEVTYRPAKDESGNTVQVGDPSFIVQIPRKNPDADPVTGLGVASDNGATTPIPSGDSVDQSARPNGNAMIGADAADPMRALSH